MKIFDLQQQYNTLAFQKPNNTTIEMINYDAININDLKKNHDQLVNENKVFEVKGLLSL